MKINTKQRIVIVLLSLLIGTSVQSQSLRLKKANKYFSEFSYDKAISAYEDIDDKGPAIYRNLAKSYLMLGKIDQAENNYASLMSTGSYKPEDVYDYASVLMMNKKYDEAANWMEKYYKLNPDDSRAQAFMENPMYYRELLQSDPKMQLDNLDINTGYEDFSPVYYKDSEVIFASSRDDSHLINRKWNGNQQPFLDLYVADLTEGNNLSNVRKFNEVVNKKYHDAPAAFNQAGDYMLVTRNIYADDNLQDNKLWLYESHLIDGSYWDEPHPLYFNDKHFSTGQATLSPDGKTMYFASDRPGGFGGTDIYKSVKGRDGKWSAPENLGPKINSEGNEMFPYYDAKGGYLFFSSNGWPGIGGLDIFVSKVKRDGGYTKPQNLGAPINSNRDDFSFIYQKDGSGFLSSNRAGGHGDDDIYSFKNMLKFQDKVKDCDLSGTITDKKTQEPLAYARVILTDKDGNKLKEVETKADGKYAFGIDCGNYYKVLVLRQPYKEANADIDTKTYDSPHIVKDFALENPMAEIPAKEEGKNLCDYKLPTIYYDLDKFYIRFNDKLKLDEVVALMNKYPMMKVQVSSHTDARASKPYNVKLSHNRTNSAMHYLITHGISKDRLVPKWFGETQPVNGCVDGVKCTEAEHQLNRRTEFKILNCEELTKQ